MHGELIPTLCCRCQFSGMAPEGGLCPSCGAGPGRLSATRVTRIGNVPVPIPPDPIGRLDAFRISKAVEQFIDCPPGFAGLPSPNRERARRGRERPNRSRRSQAYVGSPGDGEGQAEPVMEGRMTAANRARKKISDRWRDRARELHDQGRSSPVIAIRLTRERDAEHEWAGRPKRPRFHVRTVEGYLRGYKTPAQRPSARREDDLPE